MGRVAKLLHGSAANGAYDFTGPDVDEFLHDNGFKPLRDMVGILASGVISRDVPWAGSWVESIIMTSSGDVDLHSHHEWEIDNLSNQLTDFLDSFGATLMMQAKFTLRVSDASVNLTPKIYNVSLGADATISGASACSSTNEDRAGASQVQTVTLTMPANSKHKFKPRVTKGGSVGDGKYGWALCSRSLYIQSSPTAW